jgi:carboxyl-terminal processing protease
MRKIGQDGKRQRNQSPKIVAFPLFYNSYPKTAPTYFFQRAGAREKCRKRTFLPFFRIPNSPFPNLSFNFTGLRTYGCPKKWRSAFSHLQPPALPLFSLFTYQMRMKNLTKLFRTASKKHAHEDAQRRHTDFVAPSLPRIKKKSSKWRIAGLGLMGSLLIGFGFAFSPGEKYFEIAKNLDIFASLFKEINTYYVDEIKPTDLIEHGINAMLERLDPYTNYIPEDNIENYRIMTTGQYSGIGASIQMRNGKMRVLMPMEGFAADKAGLKIGDEIIEIDGVDVRGKEEAGDLLRGQSGTVVKLKILRYGEPKPLEISVTREKIQTTSVPYYGMVTEDIGIIRLSEFTRDAGKEVEKALKELKEQGAKKMILDLRGNPGGLLHEAVEVSNLFIPKGSEIVSTKGKIKEWNKTYTAQNKAFDEEIPLAILTNRGSASASEIVAGVVQDYDRGVLVGQNTFGKGLVQATRSLSYNSKLKVTVAKYYIPSGRCIQAMDYSHRNPDGSVAKVPDSLRVPFKTKGGRTFYDGGGVAPDLELPSPEHSLIAQSLIRNYLLFDYATIYYYQNPNKVVDARNFQLQDAEYEAFVKWLADKEYDYQTKTEAALATLEQVSQQEKSYELLKTHIEDLKKTIAKDKGLDLKAHKAEIMEILEAEIAKRYLLQKGEIEATFDDDAEIKAAVEVLNDPTRYRNILSGKK